MKKAIFTGPPFSGKSTLVKKLRKIYPSLEIKELDEMLIELNDGDWPEEEKYRNQVLIPKVIDNIINKDENFIFFTTYISPSDIRKAKNAEFLFCQFNCPREVLISRNVDDDKGRQQEMDRNLEYQTEIREMGLVDKEIDCSKTLEDMVKVISELLNLREYNDKR
jgi:adenylate kinase family enzyme